MTKASEAKDSRRSWKQKDEIDNAKASASAVAAASILITHPKGST